MKGRVGRVLCAIAALLLVAPAALHAQRLETQLYVNGFSAPVAFVPSTYDPTVFVVEKGGLIRAVVNGVVRSQPFLDLRSEVTSIGEQGLLGLAFHPAYEINRRFYVFFTRRGTTAAEFGDIVISRFLRSASDPFVADSASRADLRWGSATGPTSIEHSEFSNHNGGTLQFGPDGYLYIGLGDGGSGDDPHNHAQDPNSLLGKMLRIDVDVPDTNAQGYRVPPDNPFVDDDPVDALPEIWDFGLRNPWKFSFDDPSRGGTGALIIGDVGQGRWEEVDYEPTGEGGRNYGWRIREGAHPNLDVPSTPPAYLPLTDSVFEYAHTSGVSAVEGRSITGGYVYRGSDLSAIWRGRYFFADFVFGRVWSANISAAGAFSNIIDHTPAFGTGSVSSFGVDRRGELYAVSYSAGAVYRVCELVITPGVLVFAADGGSGTVAVTTTAECSWNVSPSAPWITLVTNSQERGRKTAIFKVVPNTTGTPRAAVLTVAGQPVTITQSASAPVLGDIDNNGSGDLLWQHTDGRLAAWMMQGHTLVDGRLLSNLLGPVVLSDPRWRLAATGDFDGDGSRDIVFQHADGSLGMWFMSGAMQLEGSALVPSRVADTNWVIRGAGDMNGDGFDDLLWQHQGTGHVAVWFMERTRQLSGELLRPGPVADLDWHIVGAGDVNRDGRPDLIWQHQTEGLIAAWLMNGTRMTSGELLTPSGVADTSWKIAAIADMNGDGWPDLVWRNSSTGQLALWFLNGLTRHGDGIRLSPSEVPDIRWRIAGPR